MSYNEAKAVLKGFEIGHKIITRACYALMLMKLVSIIYAVPTDQWILFIWRLHN
jgi:hypothetical protein